jgi:hypothetical protein
LTAQAYLLFTVLLILQNAVNALLDDVADIVWCKANLCMFSKQNVQVTVCANRRQLPAQCSAVCLLASSTLAPCSIYEDFSYTTTAEYVRKTVVRVGEKEAKDSHTRQLERLVA